MSTAVQADTSCGPYEDIKVTGTSEGVVWGSGPYGANSDIATAAVHAGLIKVGDSATIRRESVGRISTFDSSVQNGVSSFFYTQSMCAVTLSLVETDAVTNVSPSTTGVLLPITENISPDGEVNRDMVIRLQTFFNRIGYITSDNITGNFGETTIAAVKKYQCDVGITCGGDGYGYVGPLTRESINNRIVSINAQQNTYTTSTVPQSSLAASIEAILALIADLQQQLAEMQRAGSSCPEGQTVDSNGLCISGAPAGSIAPASNGVESETGSSNQPSPSTIPESGDPTTPVSKILRPVTREIVDYTSQSLILQFIAGENSAVPYSIVDSRNNRLQEGTIRTEKGLNSTTLQLSTAVMNYRGGDFLTLTLGGRTVRFGVGLLFLVAGQSNTVDSECGNCAGYTVPTDSSVVYLHDPSVTFESHNGDEIPSTDSWVTELESGSLTFEPLPESAPEVHGGAKNVWVRVGAALAESQKVPVGFIIVGVGGSAVGEWSGGKLENRLAIGKEFRLSGVLWHQGEADALLGTSKSTYESKLRSLISRTMDDVSAPWVVAQASFCRYQENDANINTPDAGVVSIEDAQISLIERGGFEDYVYPGPNTNRIPHNCHFDRKDEYDALVSAWITNLTSNGILTNRAPSTSNLPRFEPRGLENVYRFFSEKYGDHLFTNVKSEGLNATAYEYEGVGFSVFPIPKTTTSESNLKTLYRCINTTVGKHFVSEEKDCGGASYEGPYGKIFVNKPYAYLGPVIYFAKPLYTCRAYGSSTYLLTTPSLAECTASGLLDVKQLGWMPFDD